MKRIIIILNILIFASLISIYAKNTINHFVEANIIPKTAFIEIKDSLVFKEGIPKFFTLNAKLTPKSLSPNISIKKIQSNMKTGGSEKINKWSISNKNNSKTLLLKYSGKINSPIEQSKENYQRGFSETDGIISKKGIYLSGGTYWIATFEDHFNTFTLTTTLPKKWKTVSQGERISEVSKTGKHSDIWYCDKPQDEIYLIAAKFNEYSYEMKSGVKAMAFLRTPDESLANKYLEVTEQYMEMYNGLIGIFPYKKFALVENFWETGYGMPSFTLLGEKVIRFPFILHSSYPHELLHNWWGNSVYVDYASGNWCEGTTVFMSDHLIKEQRGAGENYRRSTLQKFTNYVTPKNDFPLTKFIGRHNAASEAIGYGKSMMMWQMLRRKLGDETFIKGMSKFYEDNKYKQASFNDIRIAMESVSSIELKGFFKQWTERTGAPEIELKSVRTDKVNNKYRIFLTISQNQSASVFDIDIPIIVATEKGLESYIFNMNEKTQKYQIFSESEPLKIALDPQYDVFRIVHPSEAPPAFSKILGSEQNIFILPSNASKKKITIYNDFIKQWKADVNNNFSVKYDKDLKILPKNKTAWVLGFDNKFAKIITKQLAPYNSAFTNDSVIYESKYIAKKGNDFILSVFSPETANNQICFVAIDNLKAIPGLIRKLPHYGKYSYLAFTADAPDNIAKGQFPVLNSPLIKNFTKEAEKLSVFQTRTALAYLKPVFSQKRMMSHIEYLASEELKGRGLGTPELDIAGDYIAKKFKEYGLKPLIKNSYTQEFQHTFADKGKMSLKNIVAFIEGSDEKLKNSPVVISAHYDHLGLGWPDVRKGNKGQIHYGADDNASGVSILLELAKTMGKSVKPQRTIIFIATTGEEAGLLGSRYFVKDAKKYIKGEIFANVNLDTDGRLFDKKLLVLNANSAREWKFIFMGTDYTTGVKSEIVTQELDASDQVAFIEKGIPAIQLFSGPNEDYHRPSDTFNKIDAKGLVKIATVAKEVLMYLADRKEAMNFQGTTTKKMGHPQSMGHPNKMPQNAHKGQMKTGRKASTGSIPDFAFRGKGVKVGSVIKGSAGEKAGLKAGDIIIGVNEKEVTTLKNYSQELKKYKPNDKVKFKILRKGKEIIILIKLGER